MKTKIKDELLQATAQTGKTGIVLWYTVRILLLCSVFFSESRSLLILSIGGVLFTFSVSLGHLLFSKNSFLGVLNYRVQTVACVVAFFGTFLGKTVGFSDKFEWYDVLLHIIAGVAGVIVGYYISVALNKPETGREYTFAAMSAFMISASVACFREIAEFLTDFMVGTNLCDIGAVSDEHWFYRFFGKGMTHLIPNQQKIMDTDEDMLIAVFAGGFAAAVLYIYLRVSRKEKFARIKTKRQKSLRNLPAAIRNKFFAEKEKINSDCSVVDVCIWWSVRAVMLYAAFNMPNVAEAILLSANLIGTFVITLLHLLTSKNNPLNNLSYRVQTIVTIIVFLGSYCGNYVFVYNIVPRFDLFLHFISGGMCVISGYYLSKTLFEVKTKKQAQLALLFALCFSGLVIPSHEIVEFIGDFIWGTTNQGFDWWPSSESFFFKVFGQGTGNTEIYTLFDTMYDMLLASSMACMSFVALYCALMYKIKKCEKRVPENKSSSSASVTC